MKIIKLGSYEIQRVCEHCNSILQFSTDELVHNFDDEYLIECPVCKTPISFKVGGDVKNLLDCRDQLEEKELCSKTNETCGYLNFYNDVHNIMKQYNIPDVVSLEKAIKENKRLKIDCEELKHMLDLKELS